jgi:hypothetical protein
MSAVWLYIIVREILNVICLSVAMTGHYQPSSDYPSSLWGLHLLGWTTGSYLYLFLFLFLFSQKTLVLSFVIIELMIDLFV